MVEQYEITPAYKREDGLWNLKIDEFTFPGGFVPKERSFIEIPPGSIGGNHRHPRTEVFLGVGDLQLVWQDEAGDIHETNMAGPDSLTAFVIRPLTPHAVVNRGDSPAVLLEFADDIQHDVEQVILVSPKG